MDFVLTDGSCGAGHFNNGGKCEGECLSFVQNLRIMFQSFRKRYFWNGFRHFISVSNQSILQMLTFFEVSTEFQIPAKAIIAVTKIHYIEWYQRRVPYYFLQRISDGFHRSCNESILSSLLAYNEALLCCGPACGIDHYNVVLWACGLDLWQKLWPMAQPFWPDLAAVRPNLCTVVWPCRRKWGVSLAVGILAIASIAYARANPL